MRAERGSGCRRVQARFCDQPAAEALRSGAAPILLGAFPFEVDGPAALMMPRAVLRIAAPPDWPTGPPPAVRVAATVPTPEDHRTRICRACNQLAEADSVLRKVVLARALRLAADAPLD